MGYTNLFFNSQFGTYIEGNKYVTTPSKVVYSPESEALKLRRLAKLAHSDVTFKNGPASNPFKSPLLAMDGPRNARQREEPSFFKQFLGFAQVCHFIFRWRLWVCFNCIKTAILVYFATQFSIMTFTQSISLYLHPF